MPIRYKINILEALKTGYNTNKTRKEKIMAKPRYSN